MMMEGIMGSASNSGTPIIAAPCRSRQPTLDIAKLDNAKLDNTRQASTHAASKQFGAIGKIYKTDTPDLQKNYKNRGR